MEGQIFMHVSVWCLSGIRQVLLLVCELLVLSGNPGTSVGEIL